MEKYTVKLMSAGLPAMVNYNSSGTEPENCWWGTETECNSSTIGTRASYGLLNKFESIEFAQGTTAIENGTGCYTSIKGKTSGNVTGEIFKIPGSNVSVSAMTEAESNLLGSDNARKVGTGSSSYWLASPNRDGYLKYVFGTGGVNWYGSSGTYGVRPVITLTGIALSD